MSTPIPPAFYSGKVHTITFQNVSKAFYILRMTLDSEGLVNVDGTPMIRVSGPVSVKGCVPGLTIKVGSWFGFEAKSSYDPKWGQQLEITKAPVMKDWDADAIESLLSSNGVSAVLVASIRDHFGDDFEAALSDPKRLQEVPGLGPLGAEHVAGRWTNVQIQFKTLEALRDLGIREGLIRDVWATFKDKAEEVLTQNPWALVQVAGMSFRDADEVASRLKLDMSSPLRVRGAVIYASRGGSYGHLYLRTGDVFAQVQQDIPGITKQEFAEALMTCNEEGVLVLDKETRPGTVAIYEPWSYEVETESSSMLRERAVSAAWSDDERTLKYLRGFMSVGPKCEALVRDLIAVPDIPGLAVYQVVCQAVDEWGGQADLVLSEDQKQGVINALTAPVSLLSGLPGTGKTTCLKAAVRILQDHETPFLLVAPTGIAAKNLSARAGAPASTIHRAFAARGEFDSDRESGYTGIQADSRNEPKATAGSQVATENWGFGLSNVHNAKVVIIDESSMVDQHLLFRLLECTSPDCRLVFVGDHAQLPSVGPGNVLRDMIHSGIFPTVRLTQIFRQADTSGIVYAAHNIFKGDMPEITPDFRLISMASENEIADMILRIAQRFYDERVNFQILSPRHQGVVGVTNLNTRLREQLNPKSQGQGEVHLGNDVIRVDDRIMVIKNDYARGIFNGDVGKVSGINRALKEVKIKIFGEVPVLISIPFHAAARLIRLAYACTVHKSQGLEYDRIVMPLVTSFQHQLQRNLLYTAITRAKKQVVLLGQEEALRMAVNNAKEDARMTLFLDRLQLQ